MARNKASDHLLQETHHAGDLPAENTFSLTPTHFHDGEGRKKSVTGGKPPLYSPKPGVIFAAENLVEISSFNFPQPAKGTKPRSCTLHRRDAGPQLPLRRPIHPCA